MESRDFALGGILALLHQAPEGFLVDNRVLGHHEHEAIWNYPDLLPDLQGAVRRNGDLFARDRYGLADNRGSSHHHRLTRLLIKQKPHSVHRAMRSHLLLSAGTLNQPRLCHPAIRLLRRLPYVDIIHPFYGVCSPSPGAFSPENGVMAITPRWKRGSTIGSSLGPSNRLSAPPVLRIIANYA